MRLKITSSSNKKGATEEFPQNDKKPIKASTRREETRRFQVPMQRQGANISPT